MVEFAVILPLLMILLLGFIEFGRVLYQQNVLTKALTSGARFVARHPEALAVDCSPGAAWSAVTDLATELVVFSNTRAPRVPGLNDPGAVTFTASAQGTGSTTACVIRGAARTQFTGLLGERLLPFTNMGSIELNALGEERYIGQ